MNPYEGLFGLRESGLYELARRAGVRAGTVRRYLRSGRMTVGAFARRRIERAAQEMAL